MATIEKSMIERVCKYIEETHSRAYERRKEHIRDFKDSAECSHLLKYYLRMHINIKIEEIKIGMRLRAQYRSALDRHVGQATSIRIDQILNLNFDPRSVAAIAESRPKCRCNTLNINLNSIGALSPDFEEVREEDADEKLFMTEIQRLKKMK